MGVSDVEYIFCVGDSLTFGARDEYHSSYPAELSRLFLEKKRKKVHGLNFGISGETSSQLLRRVYANKKSCPEVRTSLLLIGTNDTFLPQREDVYRDNLRQIVMILGERGERVGIGTLPPIIGPGLPNYPLYAQEQARAFNKIIKETAKENGCFVADFKGLGRYIIDTVHFGHEGYCAMAQIWYDSIEKEKIFN